MIRIAFLALALALAWVQAVGAESLTCPSGAESASTSSNATAPSAAAPVPRDQEAIEIPRSSVDPQTLAPVKRTRAGLYLTAEEASIVVGLYGERVLFVDVRTRGELIFNGMPTLVDAHVPFFLDPLDAAWNPATNSFQLVANPDFVRDVERQLAHKQLDRRDVVILICQAGSRAARGADALADAGFGRVYSVVDGFEGDPMAEGPRKGQRIVNGWRNAGLPWTMQLDRAKMYRAEQAAAREVR